MSKSISFTVKQGLRDRVGIALRLIIFREVGFSVRPFEKLIMSVAKDMKKEGRLNK